MWRTRKSRRTNDDKLVAGGDHVTRASKRDLLRVHAAAFPGRVGGDRQRLRDYLEGFWEEALASFKAAAEKEEGRKK